MIKLKRFFVRVKDRLSSMHVRFIFLVLFGSALAILAYLLCHSAIYVYVDRVYTSEEKRIERELEYVEDLQSYVTRHGITYETMDEIARWSRQNRFVYLLVYKDDEVVFRPDEEEIEQPDDGTEGSDTDNGDDTGEDAGDGSGEGTEDGTEDGAGEDADDTADQTTSGDSGGLTVDYPTKAELYQYALAGESYPLILEDGGALSCSLAEFTEYLYYDMANIISLTTAILVLASILIVYFYSVTSRIARLAKDVSTVSLGTMNHTIRSGRGRDEISKLCRNVEYMRSSIVHTLEKEREAVNANVELITSMSHDIRTPLTVLLGYLDIMKMQTNDDTMAQYISSAEQTAIRLKNLSDDMFQYFLVFSDEQSRTLCEEYDAKTLISQLFSEHTLLLTESGYELSVHVDEGVLSSSPKLLTNAPGCMRIVDNIFSNLYKYAEKTAPIHLFVHEDEGSLTVEISNTVRHSDDAVESTGIGLKTCERIAKNIGLSFLTAREGERFCVTLSIPKGDAK